MIYLLKQDGTTEEYKEAKIGKYFSVSENRFQEDIRLYGEVVICDLLFKVLNRYRELKGEAVHLNSLNRDRKKQEQLLKDGFRAAKVK
jgi:tRNA/tmRNA/rRNA uracil-C5-methylase (TrmA/RlmC/RlmD family)